MKNLYSSWLTQEQQKILDWYNLSFDHHSVLPDNFWISIVCDDVTSRIFLTLDEIEEHNDSVWIIIPLNTLRKLHVFRYYFWDKLSEIEKDISDEEIERILWIMEVPQILDIFQWAEFTEFKNATRRFVIYFLVIEQWYEAEAQIPLSFKWLEEPKGYEEWLWF